MCPVICPVIFSLIYTRLLLPCPLTCPVNFGRDSIRKIRGHAKGHPRAEVRNPHVNEAAEHPHSLWATTSLSIPWKSLLKAPPRLCATVCLDIPSARPNVHDPGPRSPNSIRVLLPKELKFHACACCPKTMNNESNRTHECPDTAPSGYINIESFDKQK